MNNDSTTPAPEFINSRPADPMAPIDWRLLAAQAEIALQIRGLQLGALISECLRISREYGEAYDIESRFDGGEFSGPALGRAELIETRAACLRYGLTPLQAYAATAERSTHKWAHFSGIMRMEDQI